MKICPGCHETYGEDALFFCKNCGEMLEEWKEPEPENPQPAPKPKKSAAVIILAILLGCVTIASAIEAAVLYDTADSRDFFRDSFYDMLDINLDLDEKYAALSEQAAFFDSYARIITSEDERYYHRYTCEDCDTDAYSFRIYNEAAAKNNGKPCPRCCPEG